VSGRVLVVDDSEVTRAILSRTLSGAGFEVLEARDGAEGALTALREMPDVVVTDLEMPTMDGFPLLRLLKADSLCSHIPVLILTSHAEAASRYWSLRTGADAYLTKDYQPQQLIAIVARLAADGRAAAPSGAGEDPEDAPPGEGSGVIGPLDVLARVARQLDNSLLQATVINTLLERGMVAGDFHEVSRAALETLGEVVDAPVLAVAVAEPQSAPQPASQPAPQSAPQSAMMQIVLQEPLGTADVDRLHAILARHLELPADAAVDLRVSGALGAATVPAAGPPAGSIPSIPALDFGRLVRRPLAVRDARGILVLLPREPQQFALLTADLLDDLIRPLTLVLDNARLSQRLHEMSTLDGLTRQLNHRAIYERLSEEIERARRYGYPLSVILCDLDHFKEVNDTHGHLAGDAVLREGAGALRRCLRATDVLGRYGGEEFLAVLPQVDLGAACAAAERLRQSLDGFPVSLESGTRVGVTGSFGVSSQDELPSQATADLLVSLADRRLYEAKAAGRNCVRPRGPERGS
jgi:two-component system, cell cycle response regulator